MLNSYNLKDTVYFPKRITNNSATLIDNIFVDGRLVYSIQPCINGLSDHDAQFIIFRSISVPINTLESIVVRNINKNNIDAFQRLLSREQWDNIFQNDNVIDACNDFHNTYLRCFHACFPKKVIKQHHIINNKWITKWIRTSCKRKRELLLLCRHSDDLNLKNYYKNSVKYYKK
jgi:hypothetical protein